MRGSGVIEVLVRRCHTALRSLSIAAAVALIGAAAVGCETPPSTPGAGPSAPTATAPALTAAPATERPEAESDGIDYRYLLLAASDVSDEEDVFAMWSATRDPSGLPGASALFVNTEDTRAISNTIVVYPDAATATSTLRTALSDVGRVVVGGIPRPAPVGTDGTIIVGASSDGTKAATLLLYTHGPALVRLQFESAPGDPTTDKFVVNVGKMQLIALRTALAEGK